MSAAPPVAGPLSDVVAAIGNTPLIRLRRASEETRCEILGKAEFLNPGFSVKDRAALFILRDAMARGEIGPGGTVIDGTAGNTGIGLALVGNALGLHSVIVMPETQSEEKKQAIRMMGAELVEVPAVPYSNPDNYVRVSERLALERARSTAGGVLWANQFDNLANRAAHFETTGPEIWEQTEGRVDGFVCAVGTGGTLSGVGLALKARKPEVVIALADPMGSALHHWVKTGTLKAEGTSITEGIGQGRVTRNLDGAPIDDSFQIADAEALPILFRLTLEEGLCLGGSSGINIAGAIRLARRLGPGHTVVTMLCDPGARYATKLYDAGFLAARGLPLAPWMQDGTRA